MKTVTEFSGFFLRGALKIRQDLFQKKKQEQKEKELEEKKAKEAAPIAPEASPEVASVEASESLPSESSESPVEAQESAVNVSENSQENRIETSEESAVSAEPVEESSALEGENSTEPSPQATEETVQASEEKKPTSGLKIDLTKKKVPFKNQKQKPQNWIELSDEDLKAALAEGLKLEGEKLDHVVNAVKAIDRKREEDLKRVVVSTLDEGEKQPEASKFIGTHLYTAEYLPSLRPAPQEHKRKFDKNRKGGKGGKRFDKKGKFGEKRGGDRRDFGNNRAPNAGTEGRSFPPSEGAPGRDGEKKNFRPRKPFNRRPPVDATARGPLKITPKGESTPPTTA